MTDRLEEIEAYWPSKTSAMALGDIEWLIAEVERLRVDNLEIADRAERLVAHRNILITECESLEAEVERLRKENEKLWDEIHMWEMINDVAEVNNAEQKQTRRSVPVVDRTDG